MDKQTIKDIIKLSKYYIKEYGHSSIYLYTTEEDLNPQIEFHVFSSTKNTRRIKICNEDMHDTNLRYYTKLEKELINIEIHHYMVVPF